MSERTRQDLDALREGLRLVEDVYRPALWRPGHEPGHTDLTPEECRLCAMDRALSAVAAVVRRELEAPAAGEHVRERVAREIREAAWADPTGLRERQNAEALADRILALLRTPRGEGPVWREALSAALDNASESQTRQGRCRPGQNGGLAAIFGQWPGDETDEEIEAALAEMERCHCGGDAEIARLSRELDEAREQVRALREAILAELHGADGVAVTEIGSEGVRRLWEALVQTEARDG